MPNNVIILLILGKILIIILYTIVLLSIIFKHEFPI